jgi:hypothetical protein
VREKMSLQRGKLANGKNETYSAVLLRKLKNETYSAVLLRKLKNESGSAVVEFVALALPLFVPVIIFLSHFAALSNDEFIVRTLARESVRAYILSANDLSATINERINDLDFNVGCAGLLCISPDNKVEITITLRSQDGKRISTATARETVSPWV